LSGEATKGDSMVDATASFDETGLKAATAAPRTVQGALARATVSAATGDALAAYEAFCQSALFAPPQSAEWVRHWAEQVRPDAIVAILEAGGRPVMALALEIERSGPFRIARFMGGRHANGNFAACDRAWPAGASSQDLQVLFRAIADARPDIDVVALQRLLPDLDGVANPLALLPTSASPNLSLAADLREGFDALIERTGGKRRRKKNRAQTRKFEAAGGFRRVRAETPEEVHNLLYAFFAMKEFRFRRMGVANVFGDPQVRLFFHKLFAEALKDAEPRFVLHGLEVAGKLRAVTGSSISGRRLICEFGAIAEDDLSHASPGDFLFYENLREADESGFSVYDFSVGDEPYKRVWCEIETRHLDLLVPLTMKGRVLAFCLRLNARVKAFIKNSPAIWNLTKTLRRKAAARRLPKRDDD
jgi:CelD/BcsL family acetyltransferase involved in cellulose biosynthesis